MSLIRASLMRMFSPSPRVEEEEEQEEQEEDEFSLTQEQTEGSTQQDESSLTHGQAGGSVQQNNSSPRQNGAGGRSEQDGPLWERVGQQAADVAEAWNHNRSNSGRTVEQQVQENRRRTASVSAGSRSSMDTAAVSVIGNDESRAERESKYDTPSPNTRTKLNFTDDVLDLLKEQQQKNDVQALEMKALYERLLAQKPETPTLSVGND